MKTDEDLPRSVCASFRSSGYSCETVVDQGWGGTSDNLLGLKAAAEGRFFLTGDRGFADVRRFPPGSHPGILVLRPRREGYSAYCRMTEVFLRAWKLADLRGCVVVATESGIRVRRPPSGT